MDDRLRRCAEDGDVDALYSILAQHPDALERLDRMEFVDTPLHIAASAGKTHFAMEIATLKPSFAGKLNQLGLSPLHVALQNGHDLLVKGMLRKVDTELVRVKGRGSITPLHYVAQTNNVAMLAHFLRVCPLSIEELTVELETAVHVAVKNGKLDAFKLLLGWLQRVNKEYILEWQDEKGNTALHIATDHNQPQVMKLLIGKVNVNSKNLVNKMTAMDIFDHQKESLDIEVGSILVRAKAKRASKCAGSTTSVADYMSRDLSFLDKLVKRFGIFGQNEASTDVLNIVLVVAVLIATATYQATISPPGGYWQDADAPVNMTKSSNTTNRTPHLAGKMILNSNYRFFLFNSIAFFTSEFIILVVITSLPSPWLIVLILLSSTYFLLVSYAMALFITFPPGGGLYPVTYAIGASALLTFGIPYVVFFINLERKSRLSLGKGKNT